MKKRIEITAAVLIFAFTGYAVLTENIKLFDLSMLPMACIVCFWMGRSLLQG